MHRGKHRGFYFLMNIIIIYIVPDRFLSIVQKHPKSSPLTSYLGNKENPEFKDIGHSSLLQKRDGKTEQHFICFVVLWQEKQKPKNKTLHS